MIRVAFTMIGGGKGTGGYNYLLNLVRVLGAHQAHRVTPVLLFGTDLSDEESGPFRALRGVEIVSTPVMNRSRRSGALASALMLGADPGLSRLLREQRIDVAFESAQFFGWRLGIPVIAWIPDFQHRHLRHMFTWRGYWRRELGFLAETVAGRTVMLSSEDARRDCERFYPRTVGHTRTVRFAVPPGDAPSPERGREVADSYGLPDRFFFMPNQLSKHKNHLLVLDALALLRSRGCNIVVVSSGKQLDERHPDYFPAVQAKQQQLGLQQEFKMLGMIPYADLTALMRASSALLNPSLFEGWSTPVEEARALGVPLILSDLDVHREQAGEDAMYFERHSAASLADVLQSFRPLNSSQRERRSLAARESAEARVRRFAEDFASLASACASQRRPS